MSDQPSRPGKSETRQRTARLFLRLSPAEQAAIIARADKAGMPVAAFLRASALGTAGPRAQRRTPMDAALMRQVLGHLGRVGNNLNQIARHLNTGRPGDQGEALIEALGDFARIRDLLYVALGKEPDHAPPAILPATPAPATTTGLPPVAAAFAAAADPGPRKIALPAASTAPEASQTSPAASDAPPAKTGSRFVRPRPSGPGKVP